MLIREGTCSILAEAAGSIRYLPAQDTQSFSVQALIPAAPTAAGALARSAALIDVTWTDESSDERIFEIRRRRRVGDDWTVWQALGSVAADVTVFADTTVTRDALYQYLVRACTGGCSDWVRSRPERAQIVPDSLAAFQGIVASGMQIDLDWTDPNASEDELILQRRVRSAEGVYAWIDLADLPENTTSYRDLNVTPGVSYQYRLRACSSVGCSGWVATGTLATPTLPAAPTSPVATALTGPTRIRLTWADESANESAFHVDRRIRNPDGTWAGWERLATRPANASTYNDTAVTAGTTYQYRVYACNLAGCSNRVASDPVTAQ
jgi:hypothetical protein